jgi:hypothetical protein
MTSVLRKILGPKSKYDPTIPYTYMGKINMLSGSDFEPIYVHCFADTLCGLVEYLKKYEVNADEVELYEVSSKGEKKIKKELCLSSTRQWLGRPEICHSLEGHYKGHINETCCSFRDRDRRGSGL